MENAYEKIVAVLADCLDIDSCKINKNSMLKDDLGIDSTEMVEIVVQIEKAFNFMFKKQVWSGWNTIEDVCNAINGINSEDMS